MLGKLAKGLRMLGYDTVYFRAGDTHRLFHLARQDKRVILTRNSRLLPKRPEDRIILVKEDQPLQQLKDLIKDGFISVNEDGLLSRCLLCNTVLERTTSKEVEGKVPDFVFYQQKEFFSCPECHRIYWPGSHHENMREKVKELFE